MRSSIPTEQISRLIPSVLIGHFISMKNTSILVLMFIPNAHILHFFPSIVSCQTRGFFLDILIFTTEFCSHTNNKCQYSRFFLLSILLYFCFLHDKLLWFFFSFPKDIVSPWIFYIVIVLVFFFTCGGMDSCTFRNNSLPS